MIAPSSLPAPLPSKQFFRKKPENRIAAAAKRLLIFLFAAVCGGFLCYAADNAQLEMENYLYAQISQPIRDIVIVQREKSSQDLELAAKAALSYRIGATGREKAIFEKNTGTSVPIASLTKLMTATVVLENPQIYDLNNPVVISQTAANQEDVPVFGNLMWGEIYTVKDLLGLMLFYSSNDAAYALAQVAGTDAFVAAMNKKAALIGLDKSVFFNTTGLDIDDGRKNQSSAEDLLALAKHILEFHPEIFSMTTIPGPYRTENGIFDFHLWDGQKLVGGKTGYTEEAGGCMIAIFDDENGRRYINILLGALSAQTRVDEMQKLINFANNYR